MSGEISTLHRPFAAFLRQERIEFVNPRSDQRSTLEAGWVDFLLIHPHRPAMLIEFKIKGGSLSKQQKEVHARLTARGFTVHVPRDLGVAIELVRHWLSNVRAEAPLTALRGVSVRHRRGHGDFVVDSAGNELRRAKPEDLLINKFPRIPEANNTP